MEHKLNFRFLAGNIRVFCRCRPLNSEEIAAGASLAIDFESVKDGELTVISNGAPKKTFRFDAVFGPHAEQGNAMTHSCFGHKAKSISTKFLLMFTFFALFS